MQCISSCLINISLLLVSRLGIDVIGWNSDTDSVSVLELMRMENRWANKRKDENKEQSVNLSSRKDKQFRPHIRST